MTRIEEVAAMTALSFGLEPFQLFMTGRDKETVLARMIAMYVARRKLGYSTVEIGRAFDRDHSVVVYSCEKIEAELAHDGRIRALVESLSRNCDFQSRIEALGAVDVLFVARKISIDPVRRSISASVMEIAALAATVLDLWSIAETAAELARLAATEPDDEPSAIERRQLMAALGRAINEEMAAICGAPESKEQ